MTQLPVKPGIDGIPTSLIPTDPAAFIDWFKNSFLPRWAANADARNAIPTSASVQITGDTNTPAGIGIGANSITNGELVKRLPLSVMGNPTGALANVRDIVASSDGQFLQRSAGALIWGPAAGSVVATDSITGIGTLVSPLQLVNDSASPGKSKYYGTDATSTLGYFPAGIASLFDGYYAQTVKAAIANSSTGTWEGGFPNLQLALQGAGSSPFSQAPIGSGTYIDSLGWISNTAASTAANLGSGLLNNQSQYSIYFGGTGNAYIGNISVGGVLMYVNVPTTGRLMFGWGAFNINPISGTAEPSTAKNVICFSKDSTDTTIQVLTCNGTGPATKTSTGVTFANFLGKTIAFKIVCTPTSAVFTIYNLDSQTVLFTTTISANLPAQNIGLNFFILSNNGPSISTISQQRLHKWFWEIATQ